ncbi:LytTR family DNA-binding domain-containing protein [Anaerotignum sp.]|uniref:LytTR family DNA-binding domain-containing protein n=1 Tax=Anaerotignum sp. TaxID=2039241 RepID=UPI00271511AB|nr:LytTR family DNA-binding domain-containing protein [Anaerotignum sp.]
MKIVIMEPQDNEEDQIIFKCRSMTPELLRMIARLKAQNSLVAYKENNIYRIKPTDIYYIEAVDNKVFFYLTEKVYESRQKLYELEESLSNCDFLRVSKSVIANLSKMKALSPALSGRFEALMDNGERVIISRQYVPDLKKRLGL